ncbi:MAG: FtsX-like permease family protein [Victivallales bacterium]|nr:FtsX-like permease family protein [Victivallales bacterium]
MTILPTLIWRDFTRQRTSVLFTFFAIAAVSCLIIWYVASIDTASLAQSNGMEGYYGKYDLGLYAERGLDDSAILAVASHSNTALASFARQADATMQLTGFDAALIPTGMGDRRSPTLIGLTDQESPFELEEGRWVAGPGECVVGTSAAHLLTAVAGQSGPGRQLRLGDRIKVRPIPRDMDAARGRGRGNVTASNQAETVLPPAERETILTVVGLVKQKVVERGTQASGPFAFGFGVGIGGKPMGANARPPAPTPGQKGSPPPRRPRRGPFGVRATGPIAPSVYVSLQEVERIVGTGKVNLAFVQLARKGTEERYLQELEAELGSSLAELGITPSDTRPPKLESGGGADADKSVVAQAWSTIAIVILASLFIIFTTLSLGVSERTRQLSLLRTIGFTRGQVALLIIYEGMALGILGWLGGLASGWLLLTLLTRLKTGVLPIVTIRGEACLFALACALLGALFASLVPAWRATRVAPGESLARTAPRLSRRKMLLAGGIGALLLACIPAMLHLPAMPDNVKLACFSTLGTLFLFSGFLLLFPSVIGLTEDLCGPLLARVFAFHPRFLANVLTTNWVRTLCTAIAMSIGLGLFTAIHIWSNSMLAMFRVPKSIPDVLVRLQESAVSPQAAQEIAAYPRIAADGKRFMRVSVAQPELDDGLGTRLRGKGSMAANAVLMGVDAAPAWDLDAPMLALRFKEGSRQQAFNAFLSPENRPCVIPETLAQNGNLHVGDTIRLRKTARRPKERRTPDKGGDTTAAPADYAEYHVVGVVDFPWTWFSKCSGVRVSSGRTAAVIFAPFTPLLQDFGALDNEFFWFNTVAGTRYADIEEHIRKIARRHARLNPLSRLLKSFSGGTLWDSGINRHFVQVSSNESLNNSLNFRALGVIKAMTRMPLLVLAFSSLALLNAMVVSVHTRRWEMGVLRACGVTRWGLVRVILSEAMLIGLCACIMSFLFGLFYAWCATALVDFAPMFGIIAPPLIIPWAQLATGYALTILLTIVAGTWPACHAGASDIAELLAGR